MAGNDWLTPWWLRSRMINDRRVIGLAGGALSVLQGVGVTAFGSLDAQELASHRSLVRLGFQQATERRDHEGLAQEGVATAQDSNGVSAR